MLLRLYAVILFTMLAAAAAGAAASSEPNGKLAWWTDARFGMFIHWGLYAEDGCFWKGQNGQSEHMMRHLRIPIPEYEQLAASFNPTNFNAEEWVRIAKNAGMKYIIITAKHHDGFAMFNSKSDPFNIVARTPFKRDPVKELAEACHHEGLRFGVYYSLGRDWHDPDVPTRDGYRSNTWDFPDESKKVFARYFERKVKPQVRELLTQYGPLAVLWFDTPEKISKSESEELVAMIHQLQPGCVINSRVGNHLGDYAVQEQKIPASGDPKPWETCMTLNGHWGYHKLDQNWKPAEMLVRHLVEVVSKGGNFLLNVGPTGEGVIPQGSVQRLAEVGQWMQINGEGIYGTTTSPFKQPFPWGFCTKKTSPASATLYLHVFDWPTDGRLQFPVMSNKIQSAKLLGSNTSLPFQIESNNAVIQLPAQAPNRLSSTVTVTLIGAPKLE